MTYRSGPPAPSAPTIPPETSGSAPNGAEPRLPDESPAIRDVSPRRTDDPVLFWTLMVTLLVAIVNTIRIAMVWR